MRSVVELEKKRSRVQSGGCVCYQLETVPLMRSVVELKKKRACVKKEDVFAAIFKLSL
jgi:hypothetical protein